MLNYKTAAGLFNGAAIILAVVLMAAGGVPWGIIALVFAFVPLIIFDVHYLRNRRMYALLEKEDWPALCLHLEDRVIRKKAYKPFLVRTLANTYLSLADCEAVTALESKAAFADPALLRQCALIFGAARILGKDYEGAVTFFQAREAEAMRGKRGLGRARAKARAGGGAGAGAETLWIRWYLGFSLLLAIRFTQAADAFIQLAGEAPPPQGQGQDGALVTGLSAYFLAGPLAKALPARRREMEEAAAAGKERVKAALPREEDWSGKARAALLEIHGAVLARHLEKAGKWLYK